MKTKNRTAAKAAAWKNAPIVELCVRELAGVAGGRRIIVYGPGCTCKKCNRS